MRSRVTGPKTWVFQRTESPDLFFQWRGGMRKDLFSRDILLDEYYLYYICFFLDYSFALFRVQTYSGKIG